ncbi:MAG: hypothetical protein ACKO96_17150, partial [Flammeovirgaceae bacterium]
QLPATMGLEGVGRVIKKDYSIPRYYKDRKTEGFTFIQVWRKSCFVINSYFSFEIRAVTCKSIRINHQSFR